MAASGEYRAPRLRDIGIALVVALIALIALFQLGDVVKLAGAVLYWLPARLGLVEQADAPQVWRHDLDTLPEAINISAAGRYMIYTSDYDLLVMTDAMRQEQAPPWLVISDAGAGERAPARYVTRGMRIYDSHLAPGRPVFSVEIPKAGDYALKAPRRPAEIAIVRDYVTGNEARIGSIFALELLLLAAPFAWLYGRPFLQRWWAQEARRRARGAEVDAAFQRLRKKHRAAREVVDLRADDDPHAPFRPK